MRRSMKILLFAISLGLLILGACTAPEYQTQPPGHPADHQAPPGPMHSSETLAQPEAVDTEPARSRHWDQAQDAHQDHNHHESVADDQIDALELEQETNHHLKHGAHQQE